MLVATCFGLGRVPVMPGTVASLAALPLGWLIAAAGGPWAVAAATILISVVGFVTADAFVRRSGETDPQAVVVDEVAGQLLVLATVPADPVLYAAAFALFRCFDIAKPWPVSWADRELPGGLGVMADDLLAAGYAITVLSLARVMAA